eukprot:TRINITY_DN22743_c0_g2_i3.p1 TRINITY_DN22743_c0_g2~~TRINITY_DN22743_c0_g2_i3.p1  ORF type:complete len:233 (+),score=-14.38 TRINITY_DN22743_c0_g2_i3:294-992(+)
MGTSYFQKLHDNKFKHVCGCFIFRGQVSFIFGFQIQLTLRISQEQNTSIFRAYFSQFSTPITCSFCNLVTLPLYLQYRFFQKKQYQIVNNILLICVPLFWLQFWQFEKKKKVLPLPPLYIYILRFFALQLRVRLSRQSQSYLFSHFRKVSTENFIITVASSHSADKSYDQKQTFQSLFFYFQSALTGIFLEDLQSPKKVIVKATIDFQSVVKVRKFDYDLTRSKLRLKITKF